MGVIRNDLYSPSNVTSLDRVGQRGSDVIALDTEASLSQPHGPGKGPDGLLGRTDPTCPMRAENRLVNALGGVD